MTVTQEQVIQAWLEKVELTIDQKLKDSGPGALVRFNQQELEAVPSYKLAVYLEHIYRGWEVDFVEGNLLFSWVEGTPGGDYGP